MSANVNLPPRVYEYIRRDYQIRYAILLNNLNTNEEINKIALIL